MANNNNNHNNNNESTRLHLTTVSNSAEELTTPTPQLGHSAPNASRPRFVEGHVFLFGWFPGFFLAGFCWQGVLPKHMWLFFHGGWFGDLMFLLIRTSSFGSVVCCCFDCALVSFYSSRGLMLISVDWELPLTWSSLVVLLYSILLCAWGALHGQFFTMWPSLKVNFKTPCQKKETSNTLNHIKTH